MRCAMIRVPSSQLLLLRNVCLRVRVRSPSVGGLSSFRDALHLLLYAILFWISAPSRCTAHEWRMTIPSGLPANRWFSCFSLPAPIRRPLGCALFSALPCASCVIVCLNIAFRASSLAAISLIPPRSLTLQPLELVLEWLVQVCMRDVGNLRESISLVSCEWCWLTWSGCRLFWKGACYARNRVLVASHSLRDVSR